MTSSAATSGRRCSWQAAAPALRVSAGAIVNITDIHAERPLQGYPLYSAAKGALLTLTRALAVELAPEVRVNAVGPGPILWPDDGQIDDGSRAPRSCAIPCSSGKGRRRILQGPSLSLMSAAYITGQVINVDGGRTAHL